MPVPAGLDARTSTAPLLSRSARTSRAAPGVIPEPDSGQEAITSSVHRPATIDSRRIVPVASSVTSSSTPSALTSPNAMAILAAGARAWTCKPFELSRLEVGKHLHGAGAVNHRGIRIAVEVDITPDKRVDTGRRQQRAGPIATCRRRYF